MSGRLIRALQRGGLAAQIDRDRWGVWRGRDRRGRMIGVLTGAEVDLLQVRDALAPFGDGAPPILIWSGSILAPNTTTPSARVLRSETQFDGRSLIERVITRCHDVELRELIRDTVKTYRADVDLEGRAGATAGMNWDGLALGGRVDGGRGRRDAGFAERPAQSAATLRALRARLSRDEIEFLRRLILAEDTPSYLAKRYGTRASLLERRAIASIRALHAAYQSTRRF